MRVGENCSDRSIELNIEQARRSKLYYAAQGQAGPGLFLGI